MPNKRATANLKEIHCQAFGVGEKPEMATAHLNHAIGALHAALDALPKVGE